MGAPGRTARRLKAGFVAFLLLTLAAALAPQDAQAQTATTTLTATAGNGQVTLNWTYAFVAGGGFATSEHTFWYYDQQEDGTWKGWGIIPASNAGTRSYTVTGLTNGTAYTFEIQPGNTVRGSPARIYPKSNAVTVTPTAAILAAPTGLTATAGNGQVALSWTKPAGTITGYKLRYAKTGAKSGATWATMTGASASTESHTVMSLDNNAEYSFMIRAVNSSGDGNATGWVTATPSTTPTRTITLSAPSTSITEGDSGSKDVIVTATLSEGAPAADPDLGNFSVSLIPDTTPGTATGSSKGANPCTAPLNPADTDWCLPDGSTLTFAEGETQSTKKVRILGDTRVEANETIKLVSSAAQPGWTPGKLTLTITDNDPPAKPAGFSATKGDTSVYLAWRNPNDASITRWEYQQKAGAGNYGSWTQITSSSATTEAHRITGLTNGTAYKFKIRAVNGRGNGVASDEVTATPNPLVAPVLTAATSTTNRQVALTWTHAGSTADDYIDGGNASVYWRTGHRLKGTDTWQNVSANVSQVTGNARRTLTTDGLADNYPNGALVEVRVQAVGSNALGTTEIHGPWSNARTVTYMNTNTAALTLTGAPVSVTAGSTSSYTVALTKAYAGTLSVTSDDADKATVSPPSLTFTTSNYNTAKTVTVTGVEAGTATINHAFRLTGASADVIPDAGTVAVTVSAATISATAGVTISPTSLTVEEGSSNTYMVKLDKAPSADVTITVSGASGDVTVDGSPLTFTSGNYSAEQTITVRAARDGDTTDDTATLTHAASSSDTDYGASLDIDDVNVTVTDTTPTFQLSTDPAAVTEGTAISLTVTSDKSISGNWPVRLALAARSSSGFDADDIPGTLGPREFDANFGAATKTGTVTIPTSTDSLTEGAEAYRITLSQRTSYVSYAVGSDSTADGALNDGATASTPAATSALGSDAGNQKVTLIWEPVRNSNPAITKWQYQQKAGAAAWGAWTDIPDSAEGEPNNARYVVTGLTNSTVYKFKARAVNNSGNGAASNETTATPTGAKTITLTTDQTNNRITEGDTQRKNIIVTATLSEDAPDEFLVNIDYGGGVGTLVGNSNVSSNNCASPSPATADICFPGGSSAASVPIESGQRTGFRTVGILPDTRDEGDEYFTMRVSTSTLGWSGDSILITIVDNDGAPTVSAPARPTGLSASAGNGQVMLSWTDPNDDSITGYEVQRRKGSDAWGGWGAISGSDAETTSHTVPSLDNDSEYHFRIRAVNAGGNSPQSAVARATPVAPVSLSIADATAAESAGTMSFTVTATPAPTSPVTFKYTVTKETGDTATAGTDFVAVTTATAATIAANASTATITVSLVDDNVLGSDKTFTVTLSEPSSGVTISDAAATGTISDDDEASVTVSTAALTVAEGGSNTYTVKLDTEPTANVTVTVAGASGDVTVTGSSLTFTTANYNTAQTVTVNAAEDTDTAADPDVTLTHSAAGGGYGSASIASVVVSVTENDTPPAPTGLAAAAGNGQVVLSWSDPSNASITSYQVRSGKTGDRDSATWDAIGSSGAGTTSHTVTGLDNEAEYSFQVRAVNAVGEGAATAWITATPVTPTVAGVTISTTALSVEEGASNTYTVKLDTAPSANVTITVAGASGDVTVSGSPLIFTPGNFGTAQTITVRAAADEDATDDTATLTHAASSVDTDYGASLGIDDVNVTVTDTTPTLQLSTDPAAVTEGTDIRLTVTSDQALTGDLTVSLTLAARDSSGFTAEDIAGTLGPRNFTAAFGNSASNTGTVTIPTSADSVVEGAEAYRITLNDATGYAIGSDVTADGALNDGTVSAPAAPSGLTASAGNGQVVLSWSDPDDDSITRYEVRYDKTGERSSAAWSAIPGSGANTGSHAVTGLDNDAQYSFQLRAVNPSGEGSATDWVTATPVSSSTVALTIADVTAVESGTFTFTVSADAAPASDVTFQYTVTARSGDTASAGADFTAVTATTRTLAAGATRTTITVAVSDDERDESDETFTVILSEPSANATLANATATGTISDDDASPVLAAMADRTLAAGQAVNLTASATDGDGDSVSYAWTRKAGENTPALPEGTALNQARLRFTIPATATGRYTMTVTASDGNGNTDSEEVVITVGGAAPPSGEPPVETPVETPTPVAGVTLSASALTVEEGGSGNYTVVLDTRPTEEVTVTIGGVAGDVTATPASLTFTSANYHTAQTVTVTAAEDDDAVTDTAVTLTHSASGGEYGAVNIDAVTVSISEDDEAGVTLSASSLTIEEGGSGNYTVVLDSQPVGGEVTVTPGSADSSVLAVSPTVLTFTASDWSLPQTVTVTGVPDDDRDDASVRVSHTVAGGDYEGVVASSVTVTVTDTPTVGQVGRANRVNARVLPQVAVAILSQTQTAVAERINAVASGQPAPASLQFGALPGRTLADERDFRPRSEPSTPTVSEMLDGAFFALPLGMSGDSTAIQPSHPALWGRGERVELSGTEQDVSWDGDLWSAHLGADMHIRPDLLAGAALSYGQGEVDTQTTDRNGQRIAGTYETTLTTIHPYVSQGWADGSHLWGSLGYGEGEVRIREGSATRKTDLSQWSVALGGRRVLLEEAGRIAGGITRVALKGEGALSQLDTDADAGLTELTVQVTRLRLLLEGSHERALADGATVTPALEAGLRHDGGDVGSGLGLEAGASLTWRDSQAGWLARLRARALVAHEKDRDEWGISALVGVEPAADGRGLSLSFGPEYGHTASGMERWFDYRLSPATINNATPDDREGRLEAELGYGIGVSRAGAMALLTPYTGFSLAQSGAETFRVGARYRLGEGLSVGIEGKHQPQAVGESSLMLRAAIRW